MRNLRCVILIASILFLAAGCKKETQPAEENDNELITTIQLDFIKRGTANKITFAWEDVDGPGGDVPEIQDIILDTNTVYDMSVTFWNKSITPAENITEEVKSESANHRLYFEPAPVSGITIDSLDKDINGLPLGLNSVWRTAASASGTVVVVLRHYPEGGKEESDEVNSTKSTTDAGAIFDVVTGE